jgi:twitching motility protein PilT
VGELVDAETARAALTAAEVGHLVISTVRASGVADTVTRLLDLFPPADQAQARHSLVTTLRGIVSQRLLERADGKGRTPAVEVLTGTGKVIDCIADPVRTHELDQVIAEGTYHGMQTLQQALVDLVKDGLISLQDALACSARPEDLRIALTSAGVNSAY